MDNIMNLQPGTAWALVVGIGLICSAAVVLFAMIPRRHRTISAKNLKIGDDGEVRIKRASITDDEVLRIARVIRDELGHDCIQRPLVRAVAGMVEPLSQATVALGERAMIDGANGLIKDGVERIKDGLESFRAVQAERLVG
jgi:hypothetical protein